MEMGWLAKQLLYASPKYAMIHGQGMEIVDVSFDGLEVETKVESGGRR